MIPRIPRHFTGRPLPERAVARFYRLLDSGALTSGDSGFAGGEAANQVAAEFSVPAATVWQWVRERAGSAPGLTRRNEARRVYR